MARGRAPADWPYQGAKRLGEAGATRGVVAFALPVLLVLCEVGALVRLEGGLCAPGGQSQGQSTPTRVSTTHMYTKAVCE